MGKKSKKKGSGKNTTKATRKERLQERREQQLGQLDDLNRDREDDGSEYERPYFEGDRVWFHEEGSWGDGSNPNAYRGIVKSVGEDSLDIVPLQSKIDGRDASVRTPKKAVFPDFCDMTLRFDVGDSVVCRTERGWATDTVGLLWPVGGRDRSPTGPEDSVPRYMCGPVSVPYDEDDFVMKHPSSFRFDVGDGVVFDPKMAEAIGRSSTQLRSSKSWLRGNISGVDITGLDHYAVYKCSFVAAGKRHSCHIVRDDDEHVARADADPRGRLFDAIEQDCSLYHLDYLATKFGIDVTVFQDSVVSKAIEHGSYQALAWLQHKCGIDVLHIEDGSGNTLLHQIASSPRAVRFVREAGKVSCLRRKPDWILYLLDSNVVVTGDTPMTCSFNASGETWLDILVRRGDVKSFDAALSPHGGLAWDLSGAGFFRRDKLAALANTVKRSGNIVMQSIFDSFVSFRKLNQQCHTIMYHATNAEDDLLRQDAMAVFWGDDALRHAAILGRFYLDWRGHSSNKLVSNPFTSLVSKGFFTLFSLLCEANDSIFLNETYQVKSGEDRNEYIQPELYAAPDDSRYDDLEVDVFTACIMGEYGQRACCRVDRYEKDFYLRCIRQYAVSCDPADCPSILSHLKGMEVYYSDKQRDGLKDYWETKIRLLQDDDNLDGRLKILDYLLCKRPNVQLNVLDAIRHRQCWALRFMDERGLVKLNADASTNRLFVKNASKFQFLEGGRIPSSMRTSTFLCFVAVEFDDLQSLQWICENSGTPIEYCHGWNLVHFSAYMGRLEIVAWLHTQPCWHYLVAEACRRKTHQNALAVHIALIEGHIHLAEMMVDLQVLMDDARGSLVFWAKKSQHEFVKQWAAEKEKPLALERDIKRLIILSKDSTTTSDKLKHFITSSKCLDIDTWQDCGYGSFDVKATMGYSLGDILHECCRSFPDHDFVLWLCVRSYFCDSSYASNDFWVRSRAKDKQPVTVPIVRKMGCAELISFAESEGYKDLATYLRKRWFKDIACVDPLTETFLLKSALDEGELLLEIRAKILRALSFLEIAGILRKAFGKLIRKGGKSNDLDDILFISSNVKKSLIDEGYADYHYDRDSISYIVRPLDMSSMYGFEHRDLHPLGLFAFGSKSISQAHMFLALEGKAELLEYCLKNMQGWTAGMEIDVVRMASFMDHSDIVEIFLSSRSDLNLLSDAKSRFEAAMLGAGEACRHRDLLHLVQIHGAPYDPIEEERRLSGDMDEDERSRIFMRKSLLCAVINGSWYCRFHRQKGQAAREREGGAGTRTSSDEDVDSRKNLRTLCVLVSKLNYTHEQILFAMELFVPSSYSYELMAEFVDLLHSVIEALEIEPIMHNEQIKTICREVVERCKRNFRHSDPLTLNRILKWLEEMARLGIDLQMTRSDFGEDNQFSEKYQELEKRQKDVWSQFDAVKNGQSLEAIQDLIKGGALELSGRDRGGLMLTHLSSAYDRVDLLKWLVVTKKMDLNSKDGQDRTALDVAKAARSASATKWIVEWQAKRKIVIFVKRNYRRLIAARKRERLVNAAISIQKHYRGTSVRKLYSSVLSHRLEESQRFSALWGHLIQSNYDFSQTSSNWSSIREKFSDMKKHAEVMYDKSYFEDTDDQLSKALTSAMQEEDCHDEVHRENTEVVPILENTSPGVTPGNEGQSKASWLTFQLTSHIAKFLKQGDPKYKSFFVRRMQQLASGQRSRILQKRLKGSQSTIYETYLEQKSGFRILWTEEGNSVVIWFVAKHKEVSRLMKLIDDAKSRVRRHHLSESLISELQNDNLLPQPIQREGVLLDVFGNVPLKLYDVNVNSIDDITMESWTPTLHLTAEERDVVGAKGTVLLLGRSGTGKTVCICNRMEYDRQKYRFDQTFSQLFVARSKRLCRYVSEAIGVHNQNSFQTFEELIYEIDTTLPSLERNERHFFPSRRINFQRFKQEFYSTHPSKGEKKISELIVWTVIRTFLKGSIEAFQSPNGILPKDSFVAIEKLGKNRCRVPANLRDQIYDLFLKYEDYKTKEGLWDDCDRIHHLLARLNESKKIDPTALDQVRRSRIYVDEVQDYTQIECLIFFYLGGPGGLFLAGDPAQSVVEGTEFRFDELRSVGYFVAGNDRRDLIPQKPKTVHMNFRSHAGILNTAAALLDFLFKFFPGSAKQLKKDQGLFQGSRPGVLHRVNVQQLSVLLSNKLKGTVILVHDDSVHRWRRFLGPNCYGIREAKGLEFKSVMILNFFQEISPSLQKPWRNLLLNRVGLDFETKHPLVGTQLKLLYTGITRCIERLFIVETKSSVAGDAVIRWLTTSSVKVESLNKMGQNRTDSLATQNNIDDIEAMSMTADEFLAQGFDNAELAESAELDLEQARNFLDRAIWCFEQADNSELASKARTNRQGILFRLNLTLPHNGKNANEQLMVETKGAQMMGSLAKEGLMFEVQKVLYSIRPFMDPAQYLRLCESMALH